MIITNNYSRTNAPTLCLRGELIRFERVRVMGIINVNADSFFAGSRANTMDEALRLAEKHIVEGASFLDIGTASSRPGAAISDAEEEWGRMEPVLSAIRKTYPQAYLSVDTYHAKVAERAVQEGADLVNDISAGSLDKEMIPTVLRLNVPYVLMHMQGTPPTMQQAPSYTDVVGEVLFELAEKAATIRRQGLTDLLIDPGFGFGKTVEQNYTLLNHLEEFNAIQAPVLVGLSRKSMVTRVLNVPSEEALNGTTVLHVWALQKGAHILRVHDVKEAMEAIRIVHLLESSR